MDRVEKGYTLYQKGNVTLKLAEDGEYQFEVKNKKTTYLVSIINGVVRCNECEDYGYRFQRESNAMNGSFLCKHCFAAIFKLGEIKGVKEQTSLMV